MPRTLRLALAAGLCAAATATAAQTPPPPQPPQPPPPPVVIAPGQLPFARPENRTDSVQARVWFERNREWARARKRVEREALASASPERLARAERVAALLNEGRCRDAKAVAVAERDLQIAANVESLCRR